jgi:hypothetical protein
MSDRWDGNTHYYEYDGLERFPGMDAFKAAEAYVWNEQQAALGLVLIVTAQDLHAGVTREEAISRARAVLEQLVHQRRDQAAVIQEPQTLLYTWRGEFLRQIFPTTGGH